MTRKKLPDDPTNSLTLAERLEAYMLENYELLEEDREKMKQVDLAFRIIYKAENPDRARKLLARHLPPGSLNKVIDLVTRLYGDFFDVNKEALRIIQHKRYERMIRHAEILENWDLVERLNGRIDKLFDLYNQEDTRKTVRRKLPKIRRSSDPKVLQEQIANNED
ncbi:MAG: hypothetical protein AAF828_06695 [Bacteroidota bacterium]